MLFRSRKPAQRGSAEANALSLQLEQHIADASRKRLASMAQTTLQLRDGWQISIEQDLSFIRQASIVREAMRAARTNTSVAIASEVPLRFQVSCLFLEDCRKYLTGDPDGNEQLHLVTGTITPEGVRVVERIEKVALDEQSPAYVKANPAVTHARLVNLTERDGHALLALFHSHISEGLDGTKPSATDIANQERFVQIGWDAIGGIFSLDGYVRFSARARTFVLPSMATVARIVAPVRGDDRQARGAHMTLWERWCRTFRTRPVNADLVEELNSSQAKIEGFTWPPTRRRISP